MGQALQGQRIWITGASGGIGEALALACAAEGADLVLSARRESELERVRAACERPEAHRVEPLDLSQPEAAFEQASRLVSELGHIDVLVNNGGISQRSLASETDLSVDRRLMEVNYLGAVALTKALLPHWLERKAGHVVAVSSLVGKFGTPLRSGYSASKHALHGFFDALRAECHDQGLSVTIVCPGYIRTGVSINALTGDGSPQGTMDDATEQGLSPEQCAARIIKAIRRKEREVLIAGREKMGVYVSRYFPGLFSSIIRKARVT